MTLRKLIQAASGKKAVFLDLDNTLYAYGPCHRQALKTVWRIYCKQIQKISFGAFSKQYNQAREVIHRRLRGQAASHSRLHYLQILLAKNNSASRALDFEKVYWDAFFTRMKLAAWVLPFLAFCEKKKIKVGIVTNLTTAIQMQKLKRLKLDKKIAFLVTSEEAGGEKPDPRIFRLALQKAKAKPAEVLGVGDELSDQGPLTAFLKVSS